MELDEDVLWKLEDYFIAKIKKLDKTEIKICRVKFGLDKKLSDSDIFLDKNLCVGTSVMIWVGQQRWLEMNTHPFFERANFVDYMKDTLETFLSIHYFNSHLKYNALIRENFWELKFIAIL